MDPNPKFKVFILKTPSSNSKWELNDDNKSPSLKLGLGPFFFLALVPPFARLLLAPRVVQ
jgi:hypothetical protein